MVFGLALLCARGVDVMEGAVGAGVESHRDRLRVSEEEEMRGVLALSHLEVAMGVASHFWDVTKGVASEAAEEDANMGVSSHRLRLGVYEKIAMKNVRHTSCARTTIA